MTKWGNTFCSSVHSWLYCECSSSPTIEVVAIGSSIVFLLSFIESRHRCLLSAVKSCRTQRLCAKLSGRLRFFQTVGLLLNKLIMGNASSPILPALHTCHMAWIVAHSPWMSVSVCLTVTVAMCCWPGVLESGTEKTLFWYVPSLWHNSWPSTCWPWKPT